MVVPVQNETQHIKDRIIEQNKASQETLSDAKRKIDKIYDARIEEIETLRKKRLALEKEEDRELSVRLKKRDDLLGEEGSAFRSGLQEEDRRSGKTQEEFSERLEMRQMKHESDLAARRLLLEEKKQRLDALRAANDREKSSENEDTKRYGGRIPFQEKKSLRELKDAEASQPSQIPLGPFGMCFAGGIPRESPLPPDFSQPPEDDAKHNLGIFPAEKKKEKEAFQVEDSMVSEGPILTEEDEDAWFAETLEEKREPFEKGGHPTDGGPSYFRQVSKTRRKEARERIEAQKQKARTLNKKFSKGGI